MNSSQGLKSDGSFVGLVYRVHHPEWAWEPLSGEGARGHGGRFNKKGAPALYTSLTESGAVREAKPFAFLQPITLCAYQVNVKPIFDATDDVNLAHRGISPNDLASPNWREETLAGETSISQALAERLIQEGYAGILVRSFVRGASASDHNLVLWKYGAELPTQVILVDDEGRLSRRED